VVNERGKDLRGERGEGSEGKGESREQKGMTRKQKKENVKSKM
jgi:hypothetical protein